MQPTRSLFNSLVSCSYLVLPDPAAPIVTAFRSRRWETSSFRACKKNSSTAFIPSYTIAPGGWPKGLGTSLQLLKAASQSRKRATWFVRDPSSSHSTIWNEFGGERCIPQEVSNVIFIWEPGVFHSLKKSAFIYDHQPCCRRLWAVYYSNFHVFKDGVRCPDSYSSHHGVREIGKETLRTTKGSNLLPQSDADPLHMSKILHLWLSNIQGSRLSLQKHAVVSLAAADHLKCFVQAVYQLKPIDTIPANMNYVLFFLWIAVLDMYFHRETCMVYGFVDRVHLSTSIEARQ